MFPRVPGSWVTAYDGSTVRDRLRKYDIRSAYLSALSENFPDPATFLPVRRVTGPGLYLLPSPCRKMLPYPWNAPGVFPVTEEELLTLPLNHHDIRSGIAYEPGGVDTAPMVADIRAWSCWKMVARMYWGRWASAPGALTAQTLGEDGEIRTETVLGNPAFNPIWASLITSRLRLRMWRTALSIPCYRIATDSIVTTAELDEGERVGDWQLEDTYPRGGVVSIRGVHPFHVEVA